jgi:hypothetical protein
MHYELPPNLPPDEARAVAAALDQYFGMGRVRPDPWSLSGRKENLRLGALQVRFQSRRPWADTQRSEFTRRGSEPLIGRGDAR